MDAYEYVFQRFAGSRQMRIASFDDLRHVRGLPEAHWVATACPIDGVACDPKFLALVDQDKNGRIRAGELLDAISWLDTRLAHPDQCALGSDVVELEAIAPGAKELRDAARIVLQNLGLGDHEKISLAEVRRTTEVFKKVTSNGDGIIPPGAITEPSVKRLAEDVLAFTGGAIDRSGEKGVDLASIEVFEKARAEALAWRDRQATIEVWGSATAPRAQLVRTLLAPVDAYFLECRMVSAQPDTARDMRIPAEKVAASIGDTAALTQALEKMPIAPPSPDGVLRFKELYRGAYYEALLRLRDEVVVPLHGLEAAGTMPEEAWRKIVENAKPALAWLDEEPKHALLGKIGEQRLREITPEDFARARFHCEEDLKVGATLAHLGELEQLILYQRWLLLLANNFVSMPYLYHQHAGEPRALFEQGTLILGGREFSLAIRIYDRQEHAQFATESGMFLLYLDVTGAKTGKLQIAVPVTTGTSENLWVGKRGIFHTIDGEELDARVVHMIVHPISLYEALTQPFVRVGQFLQRRLEALQERLDKNLDKDLDKAVPVPGAPPAPPAPPPPPQAAPPPQQQGAFGLSPALVGSSVALAAVGSSLAFIVTQVKNLITGDPFDLLYSVLVVVALLLTPIALVSWLKLRRRNIATLLEASGWALNERLRLTRSLQKMFTKVPPLPRHARVEIRDRVRATKIERAL